MYAERDKNDMYKPVKLPEVPAEERLKLQSLIMKKSEQDLNDLKRYIDKIGTSATKKQHYKLFRNIDLS